MCAKVMLALPRLLPSIASPAYREGVMDGLRTVATAHSAKGANALSAALHAGTEALVDARARVLCAEMPVAWSSSQDFSGDYGKSHQVSMKLCEFYGLLAEAVEKPAMESPLLDGGRVYLAQCTFAVGSGASAQCNLPELQPHVPMCVHLPHCAWIGGLLCC